MTSSDIMRGFFALLFGGIAAFGLEYRSDPGYSEEHPERRYNPIFLPFLLPLFFVMLFATALFLEPRFLTGQNLVSILVPVFIQLCIYYAVLLLCLPLLRKHMAAKSIAALWLVPNYLYIASQSYMQTSHPKFVIPVGNTVFRVLVIVWFAGFLFFLLKSIVQHLRYRHYLKDNSVPVQKPEILTMWQNEQKRVGIKKAKLKLFTCSELQTPVSIGLFQGSTLVILPHTNYSEEDLLLIFRHELIHIVHADAATKFFLQFCTALCWFNPLMHIAMRRCAEDLELSCDELVLEAAGEDTRERYAGLILSCAGDERGFTTCLSAGAQALKYRLSRIVHNEKRHVGGIIVGFAFFLLLFGNGSVALAYNQTTAAEIIAPVMECETTEYISYNDGYSYRSYTTDNLQSLLRYIGTLPVSNLTGNYELESENNLFINLPVNGTTYFLDLEDHRLSISSNLTDINNRQSYYLPTIPDWDFIFSLLTERPPEPVIYNFPIDLWLPEMDDADLISIFPSEIYRCNEDGSRGPQLDFQYGDPGFLCEGLPLTRAKLMFPEEPMSYSVTVHAKDKNLTYTLPESAMENDEFSLVDGHAYYEVSVLYALEDGQYECIYTFEIDPNEL